MENQNNFYIINITAYYSGNYDIYSIDFDFPFANSFWVVSENYTHIGFVHENDDFLLINTQVFSLYKISELYGETNRTIFPEIRII